MPTFHSFLHASFSIKQLLPLLYLFISPSCIISLPSSVPFPLCSVKSHSHYLPTYTLFTPSFMRFLLLNLFLILLFSSYYLIPSLSLPFLCSLSLMLKVKREHHCRLIYFSPSPARFLFINFLPFCIFSSHPLTPSLPSSVPFLKCYKLRGKIIVSLHTFHPLMYVFFLSSFLLFCIFFVSATRVIPHSRFSVPCHLCPKL